MEVKRKKRSALGKLSAWFFKVLRNSFIGKFFTNYDTVNAKFQENANKSGKKRHSSRKKRLERLLENNVFSRFIPRVFQGLLRVATRSYAIVLFVMSAIIFGMYFLNGNTLIIELNVSLTSFITSIVLMLVSFPFLFSRKTLAQTLTTNKLFSWIAFDFFGIYNDSSFEMAKGKRVNGTTLSFGLGITFAIIAYFTSPIFVISILAIIVMAYLVFRTPEIGVIVIIVSLPFADVIASNSEIVPFAIADNLITKIAICYVLFAYVAKIILRKRVFNFEYHDVWATIFIVMFTICGVDYQNIAGSLPIVVSNLVIFIAYFVFSNMIRSTEWFNKCINALTTTGLIVAGLGIIQAVLGTLSVHVGELSIFAIYQDAASSTFADNHTFAQFMVVTIPFALVHMFTRKKDGSRFGGFVIALTMTVGLLVASSQSAILGIVVGILLLLIVYNRNFIYLALILAGGGTGLFFFFRENEYARTFIMSLGIFDDEMVLSKLNAMLDGLKSFWSWPGILGTGAGTSNVESFTIQIAMEYGILALIALLLFIVMFAKLIFSYGVKAKTNNRKIRSSAGLCALVGLFTAGIFTNVWADEKIVLLSVVCVALSFAFVKIEREKIHNSYEKCELSRASLEIEISETESHDYHTSRKYVRAPKRMKQRRIPSKIEVLNDRSQIIEITTASKRPADDIEDEDIEDENRV